MEKLIYSETHKKLIKKVYGEGSKIYQICLQGGDIAPYLENEEKFISNEEIAKAETSEDFELLKATAKINLARQKCYDLYLDEVYPQRLKFERKQFEENMKAAFKEFDLED